MTTDLASGTNQVMMSFTQDPEAVAAKNVLIEVNGIETAGNCCA